MGECGGGGEGEGEGEEDMAIASLRRRFLCGRGGEVGSEIIISLVLCGMEWRALGF